jgi:sulfatase modifying factor 1
VSWPSGPGCLGYRLLTESEWEVAARGGSDANYSGGDALDAVGWHEENSGLKTYPVGQKQPNGYGLYDMSGNVWEWTWDWHGEYPTGSAADPTPASGANRVYRGGSWSSIPRNTRVSRRASSPSGRCSDGLGVRLVRTAD